MSSEPTQFGALLRRYRIAAGLTQEALGARAQISARTIADPPDRGASCFSVVENILSWEGTGKPPKWATATS